MYEGTGNVKISSPEEGGDFNITYFEVITHREQIMFPFKVVDLINKFDIEVNVENPGGMSCMAKAIRYASSKALCAFISVDAIEKLRLGKFLLKISKLKMKYFYSKQLSK